MRSELRLLWDGTLIYGAMSCHAVAGTGKCKARSGLVRSGPVWLKSKSPIDRMRRDELWSVEAFRIEFNSIVQGFCFFRELWPWSIYWVGFDSRFDLIARNNWNVNAAPYSGFLLYYTIQQTTRKQAMERMVLLMFMNHQFYSIEARRSLSEFLFCRFVLLLRNPSSSSFAFRLQL